MVQYTTKLLLVCYLHREAIKREIWPIVSKKLTLNDLDRVMAIILRHFPEVRTRPITSKGLKINPYYQQQNAQRICFFNDI